MAGFDVDIDMIHVEDTHGPDAVAEVEALLRALAPDLLRQYLPPRQDGPTLTFLLRGEDRELLLAAYQPGVGGRYSLGLGLAAQMTDHSDVLPVWCWRADAVEERRRAYAEPAPHTGDVDLVTPDELHPLVHRALYPDRIQHHAWRELRWPTIRVRCANAEWHELRFVGGRLTALAHPVWPDLPTPVPAVRPRCELGGSGRDGCPVGWPRSATTSSSAPASGVPRRLSPRSMQASTRPRSTGRDRR